MDEAVLCVLLEDIDLMLLCLLLPSLINSNNEQNVKYISIVRTVLALVKKKNLNTHCKFAKFTMGKKSFFTM